MHDNNRKGVLRFVRKAYIFLSAFLVAFVSCFAFYGSDVKADTTYYSFPFYVANDVGTILGTSTLNVSSVRGVVLNYNSSTYRYYTVVDYLYVTTSVSNAQDYFASVYMPVAQLSNITKFGSPGNWTYNNAIGWGTKSGTYNAANGATRHYYVAYTSFDPNVLWLSTYAPAGTDMLSSPQLPFNSVSNIGTYLEALIVFKETGLLPSDNNQFSISSYAGGWVKDDSAVTPAFNMNDITTDGTITPDSTPSPSPSSDPGSGSGGGSSSSNLSQSQTQSIAQGAIAFTVADGAFSASNTFSPSVSQSIDENAISVTVNNENGVTQNNIQWLDNLINNSNDGEEGENPFSEAIGNVNKFVGIGRAFAVLVGVVFGWLPWWVTDLVSMMFSMLFVFVIFRLVHVFK